MTPTHIVRVAFQRADEENSASKDNVEELCDAVGVEEGDVLGTFPKENSAPEIATVETAVNRWSAAANDVVVDSGHEPGNFNVEEIPVPSGGLIVLPMEDPVAPEIEYETPNASVGSDPASNSSSLPFSNRLQEFDERIRLVGERRFDANELDDTLSRLAPAYPPIGECPTGEIAWPENTSAGVDTDGAVHLAQRLDLLERRLAALEEHTAQSIAPSPYRETSPSAAPGTGERIDEIEDRLELSKPQTTWCEPVAFAEAHPASTEEEIVETSPNLPEAAEPEIADSQGLSNSKPHMVPMVAADFLSQARRAAMSADSSGLSSISATTNAKRPSLRTRLTLGAIGGAALVLAGVAITLRHHDSERDTLPVSSFASLQHARAMARPKLIKFGAGLSGPIDQLTEHARAGEPEAELAVGLKYLAGEGAVKNETEGAGWIAKSALQGNTPAQYWLATLYEHGRGVGVDPAQAFAWYEKAAVGGNRKAMHNLAVAYAQGSGVAKNMEEAARWFSRAATLGYVDSAFNLAVLYERGDGVPQSLLDAYKWYAIAASQGDAESKLRMSAMASELSPDALAAAQNAAASFKPEQAQTDEAFTQAVQTAR
jgi:TPR repeat protein